MLDRALTRTFAQLSTLMLVASVFTIPIHLVHAYVFKDALAVQEIGPEIRSFPEGRQVRGVAKGDLGAERNVLLIALGAEVLLLPLAYRAARRVMAVDDAGGVPGVLDAWTKLGPSTRPSPIGNVAAAATIGIGGAALVWSMGNRVADMVPADLAWMFYGAGRALAVALFVALVTGTAAALGAAPPESAVEELDPY